MQLLIDQGWINYYSCHCNGSLKQYWTNAKYPGYEIRLRPTKNTFSLLNKNMMVVGPDHLYKLAKTLVDNGLS